MAIDRTLLLIEDDETTREVLTVLLEADGWQTQAAPSGEDALRLLQASPVSPAVILTDQQLPGIAGQALAAKLRESLHARGAQAVLLGMSASMREAPGFDAMLRKPFDAAEVKALCEQLRSAERLVRNDGLVPQQDGMTTVLDRAVFLKLEGQMGKRAQELYAFALTDALDRLKRMREDLLEKDWDSYHKEAHALKGSSGMIGARKLSALAAQAEKATCVSADHLACDQLVTQMHHACGEIRLMLETLFPLSVEG